MSKLAEKIEAEDIDPILDAEPDVDVEGDEPETDAPEAVEDEEDVDVFVTIGEEAPPSEDDETERAPEWVRDLRKQYREEKKRSKELEQKVAELSGAAKPAELAKKPTLEDVDYDTDKFEMALASWYEQKRKHDEAEVARKAEQETVEKEWQQKLDGYKTAKTQLKVRDYDDAEEVVQDNFSVTQQGMILQGAENPALLVYALGKNADRAKELASIKDPVKFAFAVARLETQLKVTKRKATAQPEGRISGTGRPSGAVDNTLDRLRAEAEKTGDYSKVTAYRKKLRSAK
jgi:hypothetical protein